MDTSPQACAVLDLRFESRLENIGPALDRVIAFCRDRLSSSAAHDTLLGEVRLGLTEAVNNVVEHGYKLEPGNPVRLTVEIQSDLLRFDLFDLGPPIPDALLETLLRDAEEDPLAAFQTEAIPEVAALPEGGWGSMLIKSTIDRLTYARDDGGNRLTLWKMLAQTAPGT